MLFLSRLVGRPVRDRAGESFGKVRDLIVALGERYPPVTGLVVRVAGGRDIFLPWTDVEEIEAIGGMTKAVQSGWAKLKVEACAAEKQARIDRGEDPGEVDERAAPYVAAWTAWRDAYRPTFLALEAPVLSIAGRYGGTADAFLRDELGGTWVVDYKTRGDASRTAVYPTEPLQLAALANAELVGWIGDLYGLGRMDSYQLCSQIAQVPVANVVDANYSVVVKAPKALLPPVDAFDGIHADLVARARALGTT